ncbi:methionyl-tRNA formyltransferase [Candidatus Desulfovibrio trichonymphae]|uniref:Methionyl-tRNA formyltransferase n=1 Tax=Candidatus Desulfovibrio trichonymphae TaxID=1725232 RepID=A0A1J1DX84_9BACT|nr:methionyl-tRNA formyltransferase [Candidatus Desulfovibrio trichonymphae]BAV92484.1 methionyl-tRNA formyltransferase [Candidatus Desulfovibrio trichonymphae]GHU90235.1 methionyl-tRNA formyltransferase [Deltaproteobacteria bacterium]GHU95994.1 methionyl-tRNA formyltransferase [Deltaproteobacteria bacterium]GHU97495.1 methionyl-tRNA formyltransferase [Deltaproteobacteria bacterium]
MAAPQKARIVFMGTPEFAARILRGLLFWPKGRVVAVYTRPDRPAGRGHKIAVSPVKVLALASSLPVIQPLHFNSTAAFDELAAFAPDFLAVAAYGMILPDRIIAVPRLAPLNVHASLLPLYRGAAPVQRALMENWHDGAVTGVSVMHMVSQLDAGPVYAVQTVPISDSTAGQMQDLLAQEGSRLLCAVMDDLLSGRANPGKQDSDKASYAAKIRKKDLIINWNLPALAVHAHLRALAPWPSARALFRFVGWTDDWSLLLFPGFPGDPLTGETPGVLSHTRHALAVACADRWYELDLVRPEGSATMSVRDFVNGRLRGMPYGLCGAALS